MSITRQFIRLNINRLSSSPTVDQQTNEMAWFWRGHDLGIGVNFLSSSTVQGLENVSTVTCELRPKGSPTVAAVMSKSVDSVDFETVTDITSEEQVTFEFDDSETALDLGTGNEDKVFVATFYLLTTDAGADPIFWGRAFINCINPGSTAEASPAPDVEYYTTVESDALFDPLKAASIRWVPIWDRATGQATGQIAPVRAVLSGPDSYTLQVGDATNP